MARRVLTVLIKVLCCLLFPFAVLATSIGIILNGKEDSFWVLLFVFPMLLFLPISWRHFSPSLKKYQKLVFHLIFSLTVVVSLQLITNWHERSLGFYRYGYQLGNGLGPFKIFTQNDFMQSSLKGILSILPYSTQYLLYVAEDSTRVFKIKLDFEGPAKKEICKDLRSYECFKTVFIKTNEKAALGNTGSILMVALGAKIIFKEKKKGDVRSIINSSIDILDLGSLAFRFIKNESRVENIILNFPKADFDRISKSDKEKLDNADLLKDANWKLLLIGFDTSELKIEKNDSSIEAYLLQKVEDEVIAKFDSSLRSKMNKIKLNTTRKLEGDYKEKLSSNEADYYRKLLEDY